MYKEKRDSVCVIHQPDARALLKAGFTIIDIKADREDSTGKKSVFIFKNEPGLYEKLRELNNKKCFSDMA